MLQAWFAGAEGAPDGPTPLLAAGAEDAACLDGSEVTVDGVKIIMGMDPSNPPPMLTSANAMESAGLLTATSEAMQGDQVEAEAEGAEASGGGGGDDQTRPAAGKIIVSQGRDAGAQGALAGSEGEVDKWHGGKEGVVSKGDAEPYSYRSKAVSGPPPGTLGWRGLNVKDREALVAAAARSGVALVMEGPEVSDSA